jgi:hypothetical protein
MERKSAFSYHVEIDLQRKSKILYALMLHIHARRNTGWGMMGGP